MHCAGQRMHFRVISKSLGKTETCATLLKAHDRAREMDSILRDNQLPPDARVEPISTPPARVAAEREKQSPKRIGRGASGGNFGQKKNRKRNPKRGSK